MKTIHNCFICVLYIVFVLTFDKAESNLQNCSRPHSRLARNIINKLIIPAYKELNLMIPDECLWKPSRDVYLSQEEAKAMLSSMDWECVLCGKRFYSEHSLDDHFVRKHDSVANKGADAVCLSDLCPILRCDVLSPSHNAIFWEKALCREEEMKTRRLECQDVLKRCIPSNEKNSKVLSEWLNKSICGYINCGNHWEKPDLIKDKIPTYALVVGIIALMFIICYYVIMCLHCSEIQSSQRSSVELSSDEYFWKYQNHPEDATVRYRINRSYNR